ncbi:MAG: sigma-70 family RNA polymerase sigma factor [Planctomycetes bacterium]|nr:sigma-70 family RNA polymerase sigma factor [Planctomycetota bacterium]
MRCRPRKDEPPDETTRHVRAALEGDRGSLGWLAERFSPWLLAQARYRMGSELRRQVDPEDVVEDVWAAALPRLGELTSRDGRMTPVVVRFLSTVLLYRVNAVLREAARRSVAVAERGSAASESWTWTGRGPLTSAAEREGVQRVVDAIASLSEQDREILVLRCLEQHPARDVATLLGIGESAVYVRQHRAIRRLREVLVDDADLLAVRGG